MSDRSAESSITGYSYQFLITILHILENNLDSECIIEGIEDFDIIFVDDRYLNQYKYHVTLYVIFSIFFTYSLYFNIRKRISVSRKPFVFNRPL